MLSTTEYVKLLNVKSGAGTTVNGLSIGARVAGVAVIKTPRAE